MNDKGEYEPFECNEESIKLFGFNDKQDFFDNYFDIYPEFQPDGSVSIDIKRKLVEEAFARGKNVAEFLFQTKDGVPIPSEIVLVRVEYGGDYVVAGYTRDMREHKKMMADLEKRDLLLNSMNKVAFLLLSATSEDSFDKTLHEGMGIIGRCLDADRVQIWKADTRDDVEYIDLRYKWVSEIGDRVSDVPEGIPFIKTERWKEFFADREIINVPISSLPQENRDFLSGIDIKSTIIIPIFRDEEFWGLFCVDDCTKERYYSESEVGILKSAALMLYNAIIRNTEAAEARKAHIHAQTLLDATPLAASLWDTNYNIFACNEEAVRSFGVKNKQDFIDRFMDLSPELQPDGSRSADEIRLIVRKAFDNGYYSCDWIHQDANGTLIPSEVTLVRVSIENRNAVAAYVRDMREHSRMIQDIRDASEKLEEALAETQKANNAKSDFLANMSHEMRTPLNAIIGLSGLTMETADLDKETSLNLKKIYSSGEMLLNIVNDILDISKIEAGRMELNEVDYDVPSLINDTVKQNAVRIGEKPISLKLDVGEDVFSRLYGDDLRIKQIMNNLLSNAIKYTEEGTITLTLRCEQDRDKVWLTIKIRDTGKGIRLEDMDQLFKDFEQLDLDANRKTEGTGLGLPITKSLAEMMGGYIEVESEYGKGSVFTVKIEQGFISDVHIGRDVVSSLQAYDYSSKHGRSDHFRRIRLPYARVLVVDDNVTNLDVARGLLKPYGMQIDCITDGQTAVDTIRDENPRYDAVFMDHMMPGIDGIEAARIIREEIGTDYAKTIPIIALTANAIAGNEELFLSKGFQAFISKPIELARLDQVIRVWVRDKDRERSMQEDEEKEQLILAGKKESFVPYTAGIGSEVLDINKGIARFGGNDETYFDVLRSFKINTIPLLESIKDISADNLADYAVTVHGIKGASRSICAEPVSDLAESLEKAAKAGAFDYVSANNPPFLEAAYDLISKIDAALHKFHPDKPKQAAAAPDRDLLNRLLQACERFGTDDIDALIEELDSYEYESGGDFINGLIRSANHYDYIDMKEKLLSMLKNEEA